MRSLTLPFPRREAASSNQSPEPTAVGACSSAVAVHAASRRWLGSWSFEPSMSNARRSFGKGMAALIRPPGTFSHLMGEGILFYAVYPGWRSLPRLPRANIFLPIQGDRVVGRGQAAALGPFPVIARACGPYDFPQLDPGQWLGLVAFAALKQPWAVCLNAFSVLRTASAGKRRSAPGRCPGLTNYIYLTTRRRMIRPRPAKPEATKATDDGSGTGTVVKVWSK